MALIGEDCHFFMTLGCVRGDQCAFRHQPAALTTEVKCPDWIQGECLKPNCGLRHVPVDRTQSRKMCYYENQRSGCLKANCPFIHVKKSATPLETPAVAVNPSNIVSAPQKVAPISNNPLLDQPPSIAKQLPKPPIVKVPPQPTPVQSNLVNGIYLQQSRGILGAGPPSAQVLTQQLLLKQSGSNALAVTSMTQQHNFTTAQPISSGAKTFSNGLPKTEHFNEQVRLFKEMLSNKQKDADTVEKNKHYYTDSDSDYESRKTKEKYKSKKSRKERHNVPKAKKKNKSDWMDKVDQEVLYGDYKNIPLDKKRRRNYKGGEENIRAESDSDISIKSYEEILREKALRKLMEARNKKFEDDFDNIIQSSGKIKKSKKYSSDGDETVDTKQKRRQELDLDNEIFSKEDAVELEIEMDEFSAEAEEVKKPTRRNSGTSNRGSRSRKEHTEHGRNENRQKPQSHKHDHQSSKKSNNKDDIMKIEKTSAEDSNIEGNSKKESDNYQKDKQPENQESEKKPEDAIMIIPDETTDINFSVDVDDDLALELSDSNQEKASKKSTKKVSSVVNTIEKKPSKKTDGNEKDTKEGNKRKIMVVDSPVEIKKSEQKAKKKKVISLAKDSSTQKQEKAPQQSNTKEEEEEEEEEKEESNQPDGGEQSTEIKEIKIKTFEEIMAEKRKRKNREKTDVVVLSDSSLSDTQQAKTSESLKTRSDNFKSQVLRTIKSQVLKTEPSTAPSKTAAQLRREKLRQAKEEYEKRRKSQQLYLEKGLAQSHSYEKARLDDANSAPKKIKLNRITAPAVSTTTTNTTPSPTVKVRSFAEIMEEKRHRKQHEEAERTDDATTTTKLSRGKIDSKPIQTFLRHTNFSPKAESVGTPTDTITSNDVLPTTKPIETAESAETSLSKPKEVKNLTIFAISRPKAEEVQDEIKTKPKPAGTSLKSNIKVTPRPASARLDISKPAYSTSQPVIAKTVPTKLTCPVKLKRSSTSEDPTTPSDEKFAINVDSSITSKKENIKFENKSKQPIQETNADGVEGKFKQQAVVGEEIDNEENTPQSKEDIMEALDEKKRIREEELLSDDEFEKEMNDMLSSDGENGDDNDVDDVDVDDFMIELEQMIDS